MSSWLLYCHVQVSTAAASYGITLHDTCCKQYSRRCTRGPMLASLSGCACIRHGSAETSFKQAPDDVTGLLHAHYCRQTVSCQQGQGQQPINSCWGSNTTQTMLNSLLAHGLETCFSCCCHLCAHVIGIGGCSFCTAPAQLLPCSCTALGRLLSQTAAHTQRTCTTY